MFSAGVFLCTFSSLALSRTRIQTKLNHQPVSLVRGNTFRHSPQMLVVCLKLLHHVLRIHCCRPIRSCKWEAMLSCGATGLSMTVRTNLGTCTHTDGEGI